MMYKTQHRIGLIISAMFIVAACKSVKTESISKEQTNMPGILLKIAPEKVRADAGAYEGDFYWAQEENKSWGVFYNSIQGFDFIPGNEYVLQVKVDTLANPPADASKYRYTLLKVISKKPVE